MSYAMKPGSKQKNTKGSFSDKDSRKIEQFRKRDTGAGSRVVSAKDRGTSPSGARYASPTKVSKEKAIKVKKKGYSL